MKRWLTKNERWFWATAIVSLIVGYTYPIESEIQNISAAIVSIISLIIIVFLVQNFNLNIKTINNSTDFYAILLASLTSIFLISGITWSFYRTFKINNVLRNVMIETSLTTSMVFIILIGAAMLTSAFRGFGGEEIVKDFQLFLEL